MAKTTAPLFSVSAAGTIGRLVTFRRVMIGGVAQVRPMTPAPPTQRQAEHRALMAAARLAWRDLDATTRAAWIVYANHIGLPSFATYCREWFTQRPASPADLLLPAID